MVLWCLEGGDLGAWMGGALARGWWHVTPGEFWLQGAGAWGFQCLGVACDS